MNDLARAVAEQTGLSQEQALAAVQALADELIDRLAADGQVRLGDFGTFALRQRKARRGRNPRTGEAVVIPATVRAAFREGPALKRVLACLAPDDAKDGPPSRVAEGDRPRRWWQFWR